MMYKYEGKFISLLDRLDEEEREFIFRGIDDELKEVYAKARAFDEVIEKVKTEFVSEDLADSIRILVNDYEYDMEDE